jgi:hypothetical protein
MAMTARVRVLQSQGYVSATQRYLVRVTERNKPPEAVRLFCARKKKNGGALAEREVFCL